MLWVVVWNCGGQRNVNGNADRVEDGNGQNQEQTGEGWEKLNLCEGTRRTRVRKKLDSFFVCPSLQKKSHLKGR